MTQVCPLQLSAHIQHRTKLAMNELTKHHPINLKVVQRRQAKMASEITYSAQGKCTAK